MKKIARNFMSTTTSVIVSVYLPDDQYRWIILYLLLLMLLLLLNWTAVTWSYIPTEVQRLSLGLLLYRPAIIIR